MLTSAHSQQDAIGAKAAGLEVTAYSSLREVAMMILLRADQPQPFGGLSADEIAAMWSKRATIVSLAGNEFSAMGRS